MTQSIKHWLHNYEDPSSGPQNPHRKPHALVSPRMAIGGRDSWTAGYLEALGKAKQAYLAKCQVNKKNPGQTKG